MKTSDKLGLTGIITGIVIPFVGLIFSTIGLVKAEDDKTIPIVGLAVSMGAWLIWLLAI